MVNKLYNKGILTRSRSHGDRRRVVVELSDHAIAEIEQHEDAVFQVLADIIGKIGPEMTCKWCEVLEKVKAVLQIQ